jgi:hypothetical protein
VDNDPAAVKLTRELSADRPNVFCVLSDAVAFLRAILIRIDLLYLDGRHPDREDGRTPEWYRVNHRTPWVAGTQISGEFKLHPL